MAETRHTPTPWIATPSGPVMHGYSQPFAIGEHGKPNLVAGCFGDVAGGEETAEANAARIVLAVNSHEALVEALEACLDHCMNEWTSDDPRAVKARAALKDAAS